MLSHPSQQLRGMLCAVCTWAFLILVFPATAQTLAEQDTVEEETKVELERIEVTGTRIRRVDAEGALPVTIIDREMIDLSGETSLSDLIRNLSFNSFGSERSNFRNHGISNVNLRGLGAQRTLVLVDGRRLPKAPTATGLQNLGNIPLGSVERIEILSDGASAIYGSDAIGGVINVITRKDYTGWEIMYGRAEPEYGKGKREQGSLMFGTGGERYRLLLTLSFNNRDISYTRNFPDYEPARAFYANNFFTTDPVSGNPIFNFTAIPGGCQDSDAFYLEPHEESLNGEICRYDFARTAADETSEDIWGALVKWDYELGGGWNFRSTLNVTENDAFGRYAPLAYTSLFDNLPMPADSPNNPTNPESPLYDPVFGPNVPVHWAHRFEATGFRDVFWDKTLLDADVSASGWLRAVELEFGLRASRNETMQLFTGLLDWERAYQFINDGSYNLQSPAASSPEVLNQMGAAYEWELFFDQEEAYALANWDLFETGAGPVGWALGGEYRREHFDDWTNRDGSELHADRSTTSLFFETLVPITMDLEVSLAGRYDDYSDWGSEFSPKLSLRWRASEDLTLRGSWGEGFRAPQLYINSIEPYDYPWFGSGDPRSCEALGQDPNCTINYQRYVTVSESLSAETSEQYSLGLVWDPADWLSQTVDYYNITIDGEIGYFGPWTILQLDQMGLPAPPGLGVVRDASGLILSITEGWGNYGLVETSGVDLNTQLNFELGPGRWQSNLQWSWVFEYRFQVLGEQGPDIVGSTYYPESRATWSNSYDVGAFTFAWNMHYIASQDDYWDDPTGENHVPSWVTHDLQFNYHAPWDGRFTAGVQNITSRGAPNSQGNGNYDDWLYDFYGQVYYLEYTQIFD